MQGSKKPPTSEVVESSKGDRRSERNTRPPPPIRRDDRAEPDDEDVGSSRIDVVNVDGGGRGDNAASGMVNLRRELAKLHQQAALVEKSLEDQRRDRSDSLDRLERATERALQLEARLSGVEADANSLRAQHEATLAELSSARAERDDLIRAVEYAKSATADIGQLRDEVERLRAGAVEAESTAGELAKAKEETARAVAEAKQARAEAEKARQAITIAEGDAAMVGDQASKIREEAASIRAEAEKARAETKVARDEATKAQDEATKAQDEATKAQDEATKAQDEAKVARDEANKARDEATKARAELAKAQGEATKGREELTKATEELRKTRDDIARAKEDNARDRATARDRIDLLDRALEDARATSLRTESELEKARTNEERLARQLETALAATAQAESRANATAAAHATLEGSLRRLRDEIAGAFARVGHAQPPPLPHQLQHAQQQQQIISIPPEQIEPLPDSLPAEETLAAESTAPSSPASKSVPPPAPSMAPTDPSDPVVSIESIESAPPASAPEVSYASVPPQVHESGAPAPAPALAIRVPTVAPPPKEASVPPGARKTAPPPAAGTMPPASNHHTAPPPEGEWKSVPPQQYISVRPPHGEEALPPSADWRDSSPPTRRPGSGVPPPPDLESPTREALLAKLVDPDAAEEAVIELRQHPEWLRSMPPATFMAALASVDYNADASVFELARVWDREPLCHALIASLRSETEPRLREHSAWLLKHLAAPSSWKAIADLARGEDEPVQLRRWLLEALDRLAAGRAVGWRELGDLVTSMAHHPDASLRDGVVGILVSLDRSDEKRKLLMEILRKDDDEVVLASAVNGLAGVLPMELDPAVAERLLGHPSPRVQRSVKDLIERMKTLKTN